jgi:predicted acylesterase/phospholipase RssA
MTKGAMLDITTFVEGLQENFGDLTFQEAFDKTGRILNITVTPASMNGLPRLLNHLTSPNVVVWSAVAASCSVPMVFGPVQLYSKDLSGKLKQYTQQGMKWSDGSVEYDLPMSRLSELFNVNHFIVSQVNPHAAAFAGTSLDSTTVSGAVIGFMKTSAKEQLLNWTDLGLRLNVTLERLPVIRGLVPLVTQKYEGDVTSEL